MNKWPENVGLFVNSGPDDDHQLWGIWHDGGPGGHAFDAYSEQMANGLCSAIDELLNLRQENKRLILERESLRREITELEIELARLEKNNGSNDAIGISAIVAITCILSALLSAALMSHNWANGCSRYCEPFAMDRDKTFEDRVCKCMSDK